MTFFAPYDTWPKHQLVYTLSQSHQWQSSWSDQTHGIMTRWSSLASSLTISIIWSKWWDHPHRWSSLALVDAAAMLGRQLQRRPQSDLLGSSSTRTTLRWPSSSLVESLPSKNGDKVALKLFHRKSGTFLSYTFGLIVHSDNTEVNIVVTSRIITFKKWCQGSFEIVP